MVLRSVLEMGLGLVGCHMDNEDRGEVGGLPLADDQRGQGRGGQLHVPGS